MSAFRNPTYTTRDRVIPVGLFEMLMPTLDAIETGEQLRTAFGVAHGYAMMKSQDQMKVKRLTRSLTKRAHPVIYGRGPVDEEDAHG